MSKLCKTDATPTNIGQEGDVLRLQSISPVQRSGTRTTCYGISCFTVCVRSATQPSGIQATQMDVESVSSEDSFSMWEVPSEMHQDHDFLLEQLLSLSSSGITGKCCAELACGTTKRPSMTLCGKQLSDISGRWILFPHEN